MDYSVNLQRCFWSGMLCFFLQIPALYGQDANEHAFFREEFPDIWDRAMAYTLEVAEAMPADQYDFRSTDSLLTFGKHLTHIADNIYWLTGSIVLEETQPVHSGIEDPHEKADVVNFLRSAFAYGRQVAMDIDDETLSETIHFGGQTMTKERIFYLMRDHCTHHRSAAIQYLRHRGIRAPAYRGW